MSCFLCTLPTSSGMKDTKSSLGSRESTGGQNHNLEACKNNSHGWHTSLLCGVYLAGPPEHKGNRDQVEGKIGG